jgi:hypothetical protein
MRLIPCSSSPLQQFSITERNPAVNCSFALTYANGFNYNSIKPQASQRLIDSRVFLATPPNVFLKLMDKGILSFTNSSIRVCPPGCFHGNHCQLQNGHFVSLAVSCFPKLL